MGGVSLIAAHIDLTLFGLAFLPATDIEPED